MPAPHPLEPEDPEQIGEYQAVARLGAGGQGVVYLCTAPDGHAVAVKLLHDARLGGTTQGRQEFDREIKAANQVKGYTARVLATGEHAGRPYIVSEFIAGDSVQDRVHHDGPYDLTELMTLASGTASALVAIHATGFVHCDVKPANILVAPDGVRVVDFGIARALDTIAHRDHGRRGTPEFMAPEQITAGPMGPQADVFAWASTMVFAATGRPPFGFSDDEYGHGVMYRIVNQEPDLGGVPEPLRDIVAVCLLKKPTKRPSALDVVSMLGRRVAPSPAPAGAQIGDPLTGHTRTITCVAYGLAGDRPVAVTGGHDLTARVWDLSEHQQLGPPLRHDTAVLAVACGRLADRPIAITGCQDHTLNLWDLETGRRIGAPLHGHSGAVVSIALGTLDGDPGAVSVSDDRSVRLWDLAGHRQIGAPLVENNNVMSVACSELDGRPIAVVGGAWDQSVRIVDLASRRPTGLPLTGHTNSVMSVACGSLEDRPIAITGGYDRTVRIWDLAAHQETGRPLVHRSAVMSVAFGMRGGEPTVLASCADRTVRVWDLATGEQAGDLLTAGPSLAGPAIPIAFGELAGTPIAITCHEDLAIRLWSLGAS